MIKLLSIATVTLAACAHSPPPPSNAAPAAAGPSPEQIVNTPDRTDADRELDAGRKPAELLRFLALRPGMKVAELFTGGGYSAELLARAVGPTGVVYGQNTRFVLERFAEEPWSARLARPVNHVVIRVDRELDDPLPPEAHGLDLVLSNIIYHDPVWQGADRAKMNGAVLKALGAGGRT